MRVTTIHGTRDIRLEERPMPTVGAPTDVVIEVAAACICGSDLWPYRGANPITPGNTIGHEMIGVVAEVGREVASFAAGDFVIVPFCHCDGTCANCQFGMHSACVNGAMTTGGQGEYALVTQAEGTLVRVDAVPEESRWPALLALSDVMPTGWHAAISADVRPGATVAVIGDGAVGLCGVLAARELGAEQIIAMSRHQDRQQIATGFGATDLVAERGMDGVARIKELTAGVGVDAVLECVGTDESMKTALRIARPGAMVGFVGAPHGVKLPVGPMFAFNLGVRGGVAPVRKYLPGLLDLVLRGNLDPGPVFDRTLPLAEVAEGYRLMDEREAIKVLVRP